MSKRLLALAALAALASPMAMQGPGSGAPVADRQSAQQQPAAPGKTAAAAGEVKAARTGGRFYRAGRPTYLVKGKPGAAVLKRRARKLRNVRARSAKRRAA